MVAAPGRDSVGAGGDETGADHEAAADHVLSPVPHPDGGQRHRIVVPPHLHGVTLPARPVTRA